jgi:DNA-binding response OmpR family regulator
MSGLIMVVDDDAGIQDFLQIALESEGYEVKIAHDGKNALEMLETLTPDLIILDLMMPRMNGLDFLNVLEQQGRRTAFPFLLLTAGTQVEEKATRMAVDAYLSKPFDLQDLLDALDMVLHRV